MLLYAPSAYVQAKVSERVFVEGAVGSEAADRTLQTPLWLSSEGASR